MTDTTIANIPREKVVLDNTEWFEGEDGTGSFKSRVQSIRGTGLVAVTTSAVSQDVGPDMQLVQVTTSGSGLGTDVINVVSPPLTDGVNGARINQVIIIELSVQTDPGDMVHVTVDGVQDAIPLINPTPGLLVSNCNDIHLNAPGAAVCLRWTGLAFVVDFSLGQFTVASYVGSGIPVQPGGVGGFVQLAGGAGDATNDGGGVAVNGGTVFSGTHNGGAVNIQGGVAQGTGNGGDVTLDAGSGVSAGHILVGSQVPLPTADPLVSGVLFVQGPVVPGAPLALMISTGPA